jgi:hypothetical protein
VDDEAAHVVRRKLAGAGLVEVRVATGSMAPTLRAGQSVIVRAGEPEVGDVVLIEHAGAVTLHRLVARVGSRFVHAGDAEGVGAGLCAARDIVGIAELPKKPVGQVKRLKLTASAIVRALLSLGLVFALGACKPKAPPPPLLPVVSEVRVNDRTHAPENLGLDTAALAARASAVLVESGDLPVRLDAGTGPRYRLRVEVQTAALQNEKKDKGVLRVLVDLRLQPLGEKGDNLLSYEQTAVAEREWDPKAPGELKTLAQAHAQRAIEDVVKGVGARLKLARGDTAALKAAIEGKDADLKLEAMRVAGERKLKDLVPQVIPLLKSEDRETRDRAVGTLSSIGDPRAVKPLTELARFRDLADLPIVLDALSAIGGDEARSYLEFVSSGHESPEIRELAKKAIDHMQRRTAPPPR